ncbi:ATP-binding protein [Streptomyces sp. MBT58]|uniref:ATP-binding protein n=1 Tax=Streptomyces sp. MBT58 TaxID=1488389 RepID=UPI00191135B6|nr:ATP-binding protein [Streptomyces sp. MBT58]MBK5995566.1 ATP-binding protein [Streptomyces sp. MBT58]
MPSPTRRGARLARLLAVAPLGAWGLPSETAAHIVAELAANASVHGRVQGRDFQLTLAVSGRTLLIVEALADHWGITPGPVPRKTVWAEIDLVR